MIVTCVAACGWLDMLNVWRVVSMVRTDTCKTVLTTDDPDGTDLESGSFNRKERRDRTEKSPNFEQKVTKGTKFFQGGQSHDCDVCRDTRAVGFAQCLAGCVNGD